MKVRRHERRREQFRVVSDTDRGIIRFYAVYGYEKPSNGELETGFAVYAQGRYWKNMFDNQFHSEGFATKEAAEAALDARLLSMNVALEQDAQERQRKANTHSLKMFVFAGITVFFLYLGWSNYMDLWNTPRIQWTPADEWHTSWPFLPVMFFGLLAVLQNESRKECIR